jgi:hypothetical protein
MDDYGQHWIYNWLRHGFHSMTHPTYWGLHQKKIKQFWKWIQYDSVMQSRQDTSKIQCWFLLKKDLKHGTLWAAPIFRIRLSSHCHHTWGEDELQPLGPVSCCIIHWSPSSAPWRVEVPPVDCGGLAIHVLPHLSSLVNVGRNGWVVPANRETGQFLYDDTA